MSVLHKIKNIAKESANHLIQIRRHLHAHPELSFEETETALYISKQLDSLHIAHEKNIGGNGIVGIIKGRNPNAKTIALRADIDALPIEEKNDVSYCSVNKGIMHACGHDVHTTCLIGALKILNEIKDEFEGQVKFIFQPAEEKLPGGASILIKEGVLQNPEVEKIFGQHVLPQLETGRVAFKSGLSMASCDEIFITIKGNGGHGAMPHLAVDTVLIASHIVIALQQIVSRNANPILPTVLSIGKFIANGATNIIPEEVKLEGTLRTFDEVWRTQAKDKIKSIATAIAESMGATIDIHIAHGYPFLNNDITTTNNAYKHAVEYLGKENVEEHATRMTAEDFSYYTQIVPACFYRLGTGNAQKGITAPIHTPLFDVDENCLEIGAGLMAWLAYKELNIQ